MIVVGNSPRGAAVLGDLLLVSTEDGLSGGINIEVDSVTLCEQVNG